MQRDESPSRASVPRLVVTMLLVFVLLPTLFGCTALDSPADRSDDPGIVVSDYAFAESADERQPLIAPESRADWDFDMELPVAIEGSTQEQAVRSEAERDHPFLASWNDVYYITDEYEDGIQVRWLVGQRDPGSDWYIIDIEIRSE